jgi:hypothetical protein
MYHYADAYVAMETEGLPFKTAQAFDDNTYLEMRALQKIELINMFTNDTRRLTFSRVMRKPLQAI